MPHTLGPFIRGKIRRELYYLYEHVLSKTRTARINGSRLISVLKRFHLNGNTIGFHQQIQKLVLHTK